MRRPLLTTLGLLGASSLLLTACGSTTEADSSASDGADASVTVTDNHGEIEVPVAPERVVALDNTTFGTLSRMGVELVAAPKPILGDLWPEYTEDEDVLDAGAHYEPDIEAVIEAEPDLVIGGYRFSEMYDDLVEISPHTIETTPRAGEDHVAELIRQTEILGAVFDQEDVAEEIVTELEEAVAAATDAYNGEDTVMGLITSGGEISYAAPGEGRAVGVTFPTLGLQPALDQGGEDNIHGDDISLEAIAQSDPDWIIVLDIDGAFDEDGYVPASDLIAGAEALQNVPAVVEDQIIYLDPDFYLDEGIGAYTALYESIATAFAGA